MFHYESNIRKGQIVRDFFFDSYEVLSTRKHRNGQQDLLLKNKKTDEVFIAQRWSSDCFDKYKGTWERKYDFGILNSEHLANVIKEFRSLPHRLIRFKKERKYL